jgi:O-antigen biosynthesis protein
MTRPMVDVVIPVHGRSNLVLRLVDSLCGQARLGQIVLVDDASPDQDRVVLETIKEAKYYRNVSNQGFIQSVNRGVRKTESEYVLILNSDTEAYHNHCLEYMAEDLDDGAAIVGALLLYPKDDPYRAERIQHAGVYFDTSGFPQHIMANWPKDTPSANVKRVVPAVTGACLMTTRKWWEKLGGFDSKLGNGVFEDCDYCIRVRKLGGEVIYDPRAVLTHYEHQSQDANGGWFARDHIHKNFSYLLMKHGQQETSDYFWFKGV